MRKEGLSNPADRRRYPRYRIRLRGLIGAADGPQIACVICDYCNGGMLVQIAGAAPDSLARDFVLGREVRLNTEFLAQAGPRPFRIPARVAWVGGHNIGLAFRQPSHAVVTALQEHDRIARAEAGAAGAGAGAGSEARCLARMRHAANGWLPARLTALLEETTRQLVDTASLLDSNVAQQRVFEDIGTLERPGSAGLLQQKITAAASGGLTAPGDAELPDFLHDAPDELSLVDKEEFERWLQASRLANALEERFSDILGSIASRLEQLRGDQPPAPVPVAFEPRHFALALKAFAQDTELCDVSREVLFRQAEVALGERLGAFYTDLDALLDSMGATASAPEYRVEVREAPASGPGRPQAGGDGTSTAVQADTRPDNAPQEHGMRAAFSGVAPGLDPAMLARMLSSEARRREGLAGEWMGVVRDIPGLTDSMRDWLQRLDLPLTRAVVADPQFFHDSGHPLRGIIDQLWHLQMFRPSPDTDPQQDPLRHQVDALLARIPDDRPDRPLLRQVADQVGRLVADQAQMYLRNVERVAQASEGRDRVRRARQAVVAELNRRYAGRRVPDVLSELLEAGWKSLLEIAWLRGETDRSHFARLLGLLDSVVALLGGEAVDDAPLEPDPRKLTGSLREELAGTAFDPFRRKQIEHRLHRLLIPPGRHQPTLVTLSPLEDGDSDTPSPARPAEVSERAWRRALERCAALAVGDRVRLAEDGSATRDLRIAWVRDDGALFTLVDHRGLRVRDIGLAELAIGVHRRQVELVHEDGRAASERAVDTMLERMQQTLGHHAAHDSLTGLINRQQFHATLERVLSAPAPAVRGGAVLWVDIDQFRLINDVHGYDAGDNVLVTVARYLEGLPRCGLVGHLGGDRFAILCREIEVAEAQHLADDICVAVRAMRFAGERRKIALTASVAVVGLDAVSGGFSPLMQAADGALAVAKAEGGDRSYVYRDDDPGIARRSESVQWVAQVDEALDHGQLRLRCQPIVPVRPGTGLVPHYEVLLGVASGSEDPLPVAEFIEAAERYNRMRAVDRWVAATVIDWIAAHRDLMPALHGFAVNLSGQTASDPGFVQFVRERFDRSGIDRSWVSFEVTETVAVSDHLRTAGIIQELKDLGCRVALDDFGSGLASYSYLKELPVDWLKIDGAFIRKIAVDREDYAVVKSINEIGHFLGKKTIAEYVVDDETLRLVREIGVDFAQGFGISPPLLMDDLAQTVQRPVAASGKTAAG